MLKHLGEITNLSGLLSAIAVQREGDCVVTALFSSLPSVTSETVGLLCAFPIVNERSCDISGTTKIIKLKLSENVDWDVELNQKTPYSFWLSKWHICNISKTAKGM